MALWRKFVVGGIGALSLLGAGAVSVGAHEGNTLIEFDSMTPVGHPPVTERGIPGGGAACSINSGTGSVDRQAHVSVTVNCLVVVVAIASTTSAFPRFASCVTLPRFA